MKKRKLLGLLSGLFLFLFCSTTFVEASTFNGTENPDIRTQLEKLEEKYGLERLPESKSNSEEMPKLNFETVEEFEQFLEALSSNSHAELEIPVSKDFYLPSRASNTHTLEWNAFFPIDIGLPLFFSKVVKFGYDYTYVNGRPQFTNVYDIKSDIGGMTIAISWVHDLGVLTHYSATYSTKDTAHIKVEGHYVFGVVVGNFEIGYKVHDTWTCALVLVP